MMSDAFSPDFASRIEAVWNRQVEFTQFVNWTEELAARPALVVALYRIWLQRNDGPYAFAAWFNLGVVLAGQEDPAGAGQAYEAALACNPGFVQARFNLGMACEQLGDCTAALKHWQAVEAEASSEQADQRAVRIQALNSIGRVQEQLRQYGPACEALEQSLLLDPAQPDVIHHLVFLRQKQCKWPIYAPVGDVDAEALRAGTSALAMLNISDDPQAQLDAALNYTRHKIPTGLPRLALQRTYGHERIRVAYCSGDFCTHPVAMLTVELFELHDRDRFETYAFCWSPDDGSALRQRIMNAVEHYIPVHGMSDERIAELIRQHEIDILIDLHGQTSGAKTAMLARRPAPIQITYLGLPATTGLPCIDYVIADRYLIPEKYAQFYSEKPLYMPDVYQVSDRQRPNSPAPDPRACGLPDDQFVFCSFNNNHKYTLEVFTTWMNILRRVPDSVLWLLADNPWAETNLRQAASEQGIDPARLVFASRAAPADYLARYLLADLFLDTFPFNAGTTANDALWMGLPVLTMSGRSFAARMAGALLTAGDLPELIATDLGDYEEKAVALVADSGARQKLRDKLAQARKIGPLFDSERFTRHLEAHYGALAAGSRSRASVTTATTAQVVPALPGKPRRRQRITEVVAEAEQLQAQGDLQGAARVYREWLARGPSSDNWLAQFNLGVLLNDSGDRVAARRAIQAVLAQQPGFVPAKAALAFLERGGEGEAGRASSPDLGLPAGACC